MHLSNYELTSQSAILEFFNQNTFEIRKIIVETVKKKDGTTALKLTAYSIFFFFFLAIW